MIVSRMGHLHVWLGRRRRRVGRERASTQCGPAEPDKTGDKLFVHDVSLTIHFTACGFSPHAGKVYYANHN